MLLKTLSATALLMGATALQAQTVSLQGVVDILENQGFSEVEIERDGARVKVDAYGYRGDRELVYDARTRALLSDRWDPEDDDRNVERLARDSYDRWDRDEDERDDDRDDDWVNDDD